MPRQTVLKNKGLLKALDNERSVKELYDFLSGHRAQDNEQKHYQIKSRNKTYTFTVSSESDD